MLETLSSQVAQDNEASSNKLQNVQQHGSQINENIGPTS